MSDAVENRSQHANARPTLVTRIVPPNRENAERLWQLYQAAYLVDRELVARTLDPENGIDGLTEPVTVDALAAAIQMPDTLTIEVVDSDQASRGFVIIPYCTESPESIKHFGDYFLSDVFPRQGLRFRSRDDEAQFDALMARGNLLYFAEFVSNAGRAVSAALMQAVFCQVCIERLGGTATVLGKCLDAVRIGKAFNSHGNRPVKALAESLGLEKIAGCDQTRAVSIDDPACLTALGFAGAGVPHDVDAILTFALYCGDARGAIESLAAKR